MSTFFQSLLAGEVNLSIASLPLTLFLSALPHWYTIYQAERNKVQGGWTNQNPRAFVARLNSRAAAGNKLTDLEEMILRGQSAQQNGFEWWAVWAVAVVCSFASCVVFSLFFHLALYFLMSLRSLFWRRKGEQEDRKVITMLTGDPLFSRSSATSPRSPSRT